MHICPKQTLTKLLGAALVLSPMVLGACNQAELPQAELAELPEAELPEVETPGLEERVSQLEVREQVRSVLLNFVAIVDSGDPNRMVELLPMFHSDVSLRVIDFRGEEHRFEGTDELRRNYGPIIASAQADLVPSAIMVELDGDRATAMFRGIGSVSPPPELDLGVDPDQRLLIFVDGTATFEREGEDWKLKTIELKHSQATTLPVHEE